MRRKRLILIAPTTSYRLHDFLRAAESLGVDTLILSNRCRTLSRLWPQQNLLSVPYSRPAEAVAKVADYCQDRPVDAVIPADDNTTVLAAMLAQQFGLPGNSPDSMRFCRNKYLFRHNLAQSGLPAPDFFQVPLRENPESLARRVRFPCVLKPLHLSGSRGVVRADSPAEFVEAFTRLRRLLQSREFVQKKEPESGFILIEEYIPGREVAIEGLLSEGRLDILTIFDKPDPLEGPFFEETIYLTPTRETTAVQANISATLEHACRVLGLRHGPVHAEARLNDRGVVLLEVAPRTIGGLCSRIFEFSSGISLEVLVQRHALGEKVATGDLIRSPAGVMMIPVPGTGILTSIEGVDQARRVPGVAEVSITAEVMNMLVALPEGASYPGFIFARGATVGEVETSLRQAFAALHLEISPTLSVAGEYTTACG